VRVFDGAGFRELSAAECGFSYRGSVFLREKNLAVTEVTLSLYPENPEVLAARAEEYRKRRRAAQPAGKSAGSIFKRSVEAPAGELIDRAGFKGFSVGGAKISEVHANFLINTGNATGFQAESLIIFVEDFIKKEYNISLEREIIIIGEKA
jgi:UDP-N-acetylmuramate dehydrogenase